MLPTDENTEDDTHLEATALFDSGNEYLSLDQYEQGCGLQVVVIICVLVCCEHRFPSTFLGCQLRGITTLGTSMPPIVLNPPRDS